MISGAIESILFVYINTLVPKPMNNPKNVIEKNLFLSKSSNGNQPSGPPKKLVVIFKKITAKGAAERIEGINSNTRNSFEPGIFLNI